MNMFYWDFADVIFRLPKKNVLRRRIVYAKILLQFFNYYVNFQHEFE